MARPKRALTEIRNIALPVLTLQSGVTAMPPDALAAAFNKILEFESNYLLSLNAAGTSSGLTDLTAVKTGLTGHTPYAVHVFDITTVYATGTYTFNYRETVTDFDSIT